jgi:GTPase SAR1 family protein
MSFINRHINAAQLSKFKMDDTLTIKLIVLGESSVGKSSMIVRYAEGAFDQTLGSTIGIELYQKKESIEGTA